jgi:hypothetical protein
MIKINRINGGFMIKNTLTEKDKEVAVKLLYPKIARKCIREKVHPFPLGGSWLENIDLIGDKIIAWYGFDRNGEKDVSVIVSNVKILKRN